MPSRVQPTTVLVTVRCAVPALDGGRLLFVMIEWVRRGKRISPEREGLVHLVGFVILIGFIFVMSYFDIVRILNGDSFIR